MWHVRTYVKGITITQTSLNYEANLIILPEITTQKNIQLILFFVSRYSKSTQCKVRLKYVCTCMNKIEYAYMYVIHEWLLNFNKN